ncbi:bifunctional DNA primase/polymerase [Georgenia faecalis]|uniref:bifunctional DNA primase/polymerase n=1 Tax=Georgenia faecalis TaxID=2483799 RepID=UPI000FDBD96B|nr:bifunctional DNA primase/polymerase [Georgenia faecalis]
MTTTPTPRGVPDMREAALAYAAAGVPVFPCVPGGKTPLTDNGFHGATTDRALLTDWWRRRPNANIAAPTGRSSFDVLDVDVRPTGSGFQAYHRLRDAGMLEGWIRAVRTPSGGLHLYFPGTDQRNGSLPAHHIDFRATGGYVLLPPSLGQAKTHSRRYALLETRPAPGQPLDWAAVSALLEPPTRRREPERPSRAAGVDPVPWLAAHVARQPEGNRDNALFWATCRAVEADARDLTPLIGAAVSAGLSEREATRTVRSAQDTIARSTARPARPTEPPAVAPLAH